MLKNILAMIIICSTVGTSFAAGEETIETPWQDGICKVFGTTNLRNIEKKLHSPEMPSAFDSVGNIKRNYAIFSENPGVTACDITSAVSRGALFGGLIVGPAIVAARTKKNKFETFKNGLKRMIRNKYTIVAATLALGCHGLSYKLDPTK